MCRIMTSNYNNCKSENGISISFDKGEQAGFKGRSLPMFFPVGEYNSYAELLAYKDDAVRYYVEDYYNNVLSKLDPEECLKMIPEESILLCYEDSDEICHRHLVSFWFELFLGFNTSEVIENPKRETVKRTSRPEFLKEVLEDVIKENYDMNGFDTIKDAYQYNKKKNNKSLKYVMQNA